MYDKGASVGLCTQDYKCLRIERLRSVPPQFPKNLIFIFSPLWPRKIRQTGGEFVSWCIDIHKRSNNKYSRVKVYCTNRVIQQSLFTLFGMRCIEYIYVIKLLIVNRLQWIRNMFLPMLSSARKWRTSNFCCRHVYVCRGYYLCHHSSPKIWFLYFHHCDPGKYSVNVVHKNRLEMGKQQNSTLYHIEVIILMKLNWTRMASTCLSVYF